MKTPALIALSLAVAAVPVLSHAGDDWRRKARGEDVRRIQRLDAAWRQGLKEARRDGYGEEIAAQGVILDPDAALIRPQPTPGDYRCRSFQIGGRGLTYVAYGWFKCRVELTPSGDLTLRKLTGSQRTLGDLFPDGERRLVYLGAEAWGDESPRYYVEHKDRAQAGVLERIGDDRWRLVLPFPKFGSTIEVLELRR